MSKNEGICLLLQQTGDKNKAVHVPEDSLTLDRNSTVLNSALAYVYYQDKQFSKALQYGLIFKENRNREIRSTSNSFLFWGFSKRWG